MSPKGILQWSTELSVVPREALTEDVRRETKAVMPEEQIPAAKYPLTLEAAKRSPLVAVSSKLSSKLVEHNIRVHTIGVDRMTSSFFYIAEGGGEESITVSGDLVQAVAEMLGERADNAAIERVLDSLVDRLLRSLTKDRVNELGVELAAALPRAANDGSGAQGVELDDFEKSLAALVGSSEKYAGPLQDIADKIGATTERKVDVPLYVDARKVPQGPFELTIGDRKISLGTYERWVMTGPFTEPSAKPAAAPAPAAKSEPKPATPKPAESKPKPTATPKPAESKPKPAEAKPAATTSPTPAPAKAAPLAAPITKPSDRPPAPRPKSRPDPAEVAPAAAATTKPETKAEPAPIQPQAVVAIGTPSADVAPAPAAAAEEKPAEPAKAEEKPAAKPLQKTLALGSAVFDANTTAKAEEKKPEAEPAKVQQKTMPLSAVYDPKAVEAAKKAAEPAKAAPAPAAVTKPKPAAEPKPAEKEEPQKDLAKKGFPWLAILIAVAVAVVIYQVWLSKK
jgi:hypothetical protein